MDQISNVCSHISFTFISFFRYKHFFICSFLADYSRRIFYSGTATASAHRSAARARWHKCKTLTASFSRFYIFLSFHFGAPIHRIFTHQIDDFRILRLFVYFYTIFSISCFSRFAFASAAAHTRPLSRDKRFSMPRHSPTSTADTLSFSCLSTYLSKSHFHTILHLNAIRSADWNHNAGKGILDWVAA